MPNIYGNSKVEGDLAVTNTSIFNYDSGNYDFIVKGLSDSNLLFVDASTDKVGFGINTPTSKVHIKGSTNSSTNFSLKVETSSNTNLITARNDGFVYVGDPSISSYLWINGIGGQFGFTNESGFPYLYLNSSWNGGKFYFSNGNSGSGAFAQINTTTGNWIIGDPNTTLYSDTATYKLDVRGTVSTTGFRMPTGASAGYFLTSDSSGNATWNQSNYVAPYKVYTALLSQSGTNAPVATVLENTLGGTVVWSYSGTGSYQATLTGAFTSQKTFFYAYNEAGYHAIAQSYVQKIRTLTRITDDFVSLDQVGLNFTAGVYSSAGGENNLSNVPIEIRVYP